MYAVQYLAARLNVMVIEVLSYHDVLPKMAAFCGEFWESETLKENGSILRLNFHGNISQQKAVFTGIVRNG